MKKVFTMFFACFVAVAVNAQSADYELTGFLDDENQVITEIQLGATDDLNPSVGLLNNGPDLVAATDTIYITISVDNTDLGRMYLLGSQLSGVPVDSAVALGCQTPILTAADMDNYQITSAELCYKVSFAGVTTDPDLTNNQACVQVTRLVSINEFAQDEVAVYPNPASDVINVANAENAQVSVFDMTGKVVANIENASANQEIDASNFAKGLYIVRVVDGNNIVTKKISIVK